jgi:hypothetical protein
MLVFSSSIDIEKRDKLEQIMFFNGNQKQFHLDIVKLVESFGEPEIIEKDGRLRITLPRVDCQNLFATKNGSLVGLLIFNRSSPEHIELIHIAVDEKYSSTGEYADEKLVLRMMSELKKIALMIKGLKKIHIKYRKEDGQERTLYLRKRVSSPDQQ